MSSGKRPRVRRSLGSLIVLTTGLVLLALLADQLFPLALPEQRSSYSRVVLDRNNLPLRAFPDEAGIWRHEVELAQVSPRYVEALLTYEDQYFYQHPGVNPFSLIRAAQQWLEAGEIVSGGSTITMQVARLLHPHPRSLLGKTQQILRALQLEWHLSKDEILTLYLNHAPFGGNFEGVEAASQQYLRKSSAELRDAEAALLAVLPQSPSRFRPDRHPEVAQAARDKVIDRLVKFNIWRVDEGERAKQEGVISWPPERQTIAPLFSRRLSNRYSETVIPSFIDAELQRRVQTLAAQHASRWGRETNAAVLVISNQHSEVMSYVGSAKYANPDSAGFVDMVPAIRSPGSTLKPLLFALALDQQLIHSESLFIDAPRLNTDYQPENFNTGYSGPVSAANALRLSLNIPFVELIEAYGSQRFVDQLAHVQAPLLLSSAEPNPAIILGGAGSSLESLATLYGAIMNQGLVTPLRFSQLDTPAAARRLLSPSAAWITFSSLATQPLPTLNGQRSQDPNNPIAWKSGTSWGNRDAWAIGGNHDFTVAVWIGRADSSPIANLMGAQAAGPLMTQVFDQLASTEQALIAPKTVITRTICWPDGRAAELAEHCPIGREALTIDGVTPRTLDSNHPGEFLIANRPLWVDGQGTSRLLAHCLTNDAQRLSIPIWPDSAAGLVPREFITAIPTLNAHCITPLQAASNDTSALRVEGLQPNETLRLLNDEPIEIVLNAPSAIGPVDWILDGALLNTRATSLSLNISPQLSGDHRLLIIDSAGRYRSIHFSVR
ncbi:penicillin-binding protein 1C [uncultured Umboniibacter sp.]|uniref:penicillin-binding protein 1C n=1 Tax=uncultured Umboniibacter sp. TaxID=1798917 RepID=UPI002623A9C4|nr:penicillin-binding protein 1C [uncultured Umboniibacter sp.]